MVCLVEVVVLEADWNFFGMFCDASGLDLVPPPPRFDSVLDVVPF